MKTVKTVKTVKASKTAQRQVTVLARQHFAGLAEVVGWDHAEVLVVLATFQTVDAALAAAEAFEAKLGWPVAVRS